MIIIPEHKAAIDYAAHHFIDTAHEAIDERGAFYVALAGGSTPQAIYKLISSPELRESVNWAFVHLFWSDERSVAPDNSESNYFSAMEAGLKHLPIPKEQIHRMVAERDIEQNAREYDKLIQTIVPGGSFDLVMLGMGDDGHTASLFPYSKGLTVEDRDVIANFVPSKNTWRMSFTYPCILKAKIAALYVMGAAKAEIVNTVWNGPIDIERYPVQKIRDQVQWIMDGEAAAVLHPLEM